jgi:mono/diheme cytochrome c family protein
MARSGLLCVCLGLWAFTSILLAQVPPKVDFGRDVLPLFRQNCVGCHGPSQQQAGLRLDRKSAVMKGLPACRARQQRNELPLFQTVWK